MKLLKVCGGVDIGIGKCDQSITDLAAARVITTSGNTIPDVEVGYLVPAAEEAPNEEVEKTKVASGGKKRRQMMVLRS